MAAARAADADRTRRTRGSIIGVAVVLTLAAGWVGTGAPVRAQTPAPTPPTTPSAATATTATTAAAGPGSTWSRTPVGS